MQIRLNKLIAENSKYSRRSADRLIESGQVKINHKVIQQLGIKVNPQEDVIEIAGQKLIINNQKIYIALNKPTGYTCTCADPHAEKKILDLIPEFPTLFPIGRLDKNTEGLILLTNDGNFAFKITHPKFQKEKEYYLKIKQPLSTAEIKQIEQGLNLELYKTLPAKVSKIQNDKNYCSLHLTITEGKKRQIREMFKFLGHNILYLKRLRIGKIQIKDIPKGKWRHLTPQEINSF